MTLLLVTVAETFVQHLIWSHALQHGPCHVVPVLELSKRIYEFSCFVWVVQAWQHRSWAWLPSIATLAVSTVAICRQYGSSQGMCTCSSTLPHLSHR